MALPSLLSGFKLQRILATHNSQTKVYIAQPPFQFFKARPHQFCKYVAIKAFPLPQTSNPVTQYLFNSEMKALQTLQNKPNIVKVYDIITDNDKRYCYVIMQYCERGTLNKYMQNMKQKNCMDQLMILKIFRKILNGYQQIIDALMLHRDIKPSNILVRDDGDPIFIDFGYSEDILSSKKPPIKYNVGSPSYMAPEAYLNCRFSQKSDIWSLGMLLYYMVTSNTLDYKYQVDQYFDKLTKPNSELLKFDNIIGKYSLVIKSILTNALHVSPDERATCRKLKYLIDKQIIKQLNANNFTRNTPILSSSVSPKINCNFNFGINNSNDKNVKKVENVRDANNSRSIKNDEVFNKNNKKSPIISYIPQLKRNPSQKIQSDQSIRTSYNQLSKSSQYNKVPINNHKQMSNSVKNMDNNYSNIPLTCSNTINNKSSKIQDQISLQNAKSTINLVNNQPKINNSSMLYPPSYQNIAPSPHFDTKYIYVSPKYETVTQQFPLQQKNNIKNPQCQNITNGKDTLNERPFVHHKGYHFDYYKVNSTPSQKNNYTYKTANISSSRLGQQKRLISNNNTNQGTSNQFLSSFKKLKTQIIQNRKSQPDYRHKQSFKTPNQHNLMQSLYSPKISFNI